jgi:hypothetical protein
LPEAPQHPAAQVASRARRDSAIWRSRSRWMTLASSGVVYIGLLDRRRFWTLY